MMYTGAAFSGHRNSDRRVPQLRNPSPISSKLVLDIVSKISYRACFVFCPPSRGIIPVFFVLTRNESFNLSYIEIVYIGYFSFVHRHCIELDSDIDIRYPILVEITFFSVVHNIASVFSHVGQVTDLHCTM